ncbi:MAG TPA: DUF1657 domain-containing protein [Thermoanaerobacterales bacterium]|nr:DUF1657 domain-containing protein [Thermoanaerobacterales bacterium]
MTVQSDLKKALASAKSALGSFSTFSESTQDQTAKEMFEQMAQDMERHIELLNSRLTYIEENNPLYKK